MTVYAKILIGLLSVIGVVEYVETACEFISEHYSTMTLFPLLVGIGLVVLVLAYITVLYLYMTEGKYKTATGVILAVTSAGGFYHVMEQVYEHLLAK